MDEIIRWRFVDGGGDECPETTREAKSGDGGGGPTGERKKADGMDKTESRDGIPWFSINDWAGCKSGTGDDPPSENALMGGTKVSESRGIGTTGSIKGNSGTGDGANPSGPTRFGVIDTAEPITGKSGAGNGALLGERNKGVGMETLETPESRGIATIPRGAGDVVSSGL